MTPKDLDQHKHIQTIAKDAMEFLRSFIKEGVDAQEIIDAAEKFMRERGAEYFWYHNIVACVLIGADTVTSVSGRDYKPSATKVQANDLVTVDIGPAIGNYLGDHARSFIVENGVVVSPENSTNAELVEGIKTEQELHRQFQNFVGEDMTFEQVFLHMNSVIESLGYENLDFKKNLGHSMAVKREDQAWLEAGDTTKFKDVEFFAFEPHIKKRGGAYGFKHEDIYYLEAGFDPGLKML